MKPVKIIEAELKSFLEEKSTITVSEASDFLSVEEDFIHRKLEQFVKRGIASKIAIGCSTCTGNCVSCSYNKKAHFYTLRPLHS
jgi:DeoR/GlpR family transcriptional regulator of sugar metabolism